jgi:hypothetical protein
MAAKVARAEVLGEEGI